MSWHAIVTQERSNGTVNGASFVPPCLAFITLDPVLSGWVVVFFSTPFQSINSELLKIKQAYHNVMACNCHTGKVQRNRNRCIIRATMPGIDHTGPSPQWVGRCILLHTSGSYRCRRRSHMTRVLCLVFH